MPRQYLDRSYDEDDFSSAAAFSASDPVTSGASGSLASLTSNLSIATVLVPRRTDSRGFVEFLGWHSETARRLWLTWKRMPPEMRDDFYSEDFYAFIGVSLEEAACLRCGTRNDSWHDFLYTELGLKQEFVDAIMDPRFTDLRLTASALDWALDSIYERNVYLTDKMRVSKKPGKRLSSPSLHFSAWLR